MEPEKKFYFFYFFSLKKTFRSPHLQQLLPRKGSGQPSFPSPPKTENVVGFFGFSGLGMIRSYGSLERKRREFGRGGGMAQNPRCFLGWMNVSATALLVPALRSLFISRTPLLRSPSRKIELISSSSWKSHFPVSHPLVPKSPSFPDTRPWPSPPPSAPP